MAATQNENVSARKNRWHQSTLSSLLDGCSWQYFLTYIKGLDQGLKPYASVGTAYHHAIEHHEINRMSANETTLQEMKDVAATKLAEEIDGAPEGTIDNLLPNLDAALTNWFEFHRPTVLQWIPVAIEPEFTLPLVDGARPIGGYIDAVYRDPADNRLFIVDHKTAKNFDRWRSGDGHRTQAAMYAVALVLSPDFPEIEDMPEMVYMVSRTSRSVRKDFEKGRIVRVQPNIEDVVLLGARIRQAEETVATGSYKKKTDWPLCSATWCPFYEGCEVTGELSPALLGAVLPQQSIPALSGTQGSTTVQYTTDPTDTEEVYNV
jgi:hypothetical protein